MEREPELGMRNPLVAHPLQRKDLISYNIVTLIECWNAYISFSVTFWNSFSLESAPGSLVGHIYVNY